MNEMRQAYQGLPVLGLHSLGDFAHREGAATPPGREKVNAPPPLPARPSDGRQPDC